MPTNEVSLADQQTADIADARAEFLFRSRQLFDITSYARVADMPPNRLAEASVYELYEQARDEFLKLAGAI